MKLTSHLIKAVLVSAVLVVMAVPSFAGKDTVREMAQAMARVPATALPPESKTHRLKLSLRRLQPISEYLRNLPALFSCCRRLPFEGTSMSLTARILFSRFTHTNSFKLVKNHCIINDDRKLTAGSAMKNIFNQPGDCLFVSRKIFILYLHCSGVCSLFLLQLSRLFQAR